MTSQLGAHAATSLRPDFTSLYDTVRHVPDSTTLEQDVVFFGRPDPNAKVTGTRRAGSTDLVTEYRDQTGHLVAEVFSSTEPTRDGGMNSVAKLADFAAEKYGLQSLRRFRGRTAAASESADLHCSATVVAEYQKDHEKVADVALVAIDRTGAITARAWATLAVEPPLAG